MVVAERGYIDRSDGFDYLINRQKYLLSVHVTILPTDKPDAHSPSFHNTGSPPSLKESLLNIPSSGGGRSASFQPTFGPDIWREGVAPVVSRCKLETDMKLL